MVVALVAQRTWTTHPQGQTQSQGTLVSSCETASTGAVQSSHAAARTAPVTAQNAETSAINLSGFFPGRPWHWKSMGVNLALGLDSGKVARPTNA